MAGRLAKEWARAGQAQLPFPASGRTNRTRAQAAPLEIGLHATVANMLDWLLLSPAVYTTFPAGWGKMTPAMAGILHRCGLKKGMPDILVFYDGRCLGIELKTSGRSPSQAQREMTARLNAAGVSVLIARSVEDVRDILRRWDIPMRKTVGDGR